MYYTRAVERRRTQPGPLRLLAVLIAAAPLAAQGADPDARAVWDAVTSRARVDAATVAAVTPYLPRLTAHGEVFEIAGQRVTLTLLHTTAARDAERVSAATRSALTTLGEWLGAPPVRDLVVVDVPVQSGVAGAAYPGLVITSSRWWSPSRDTAVERRLLAGLARQYVFATGDASPPWFREGLALYLGTRLIHEELEGRNFETPRFFGGAVPFPLRPIMNSPNPRDARPRPRHLPDVEQPEDAPWRAAPAGAGTRARRAGDALSTLERYLGWPAFQVALDAFFRGRAHDPAALARVAGDRGGRDLAWFTADAFDDARRYDYAIAAFESAPADAAFLTRVTVRRLGDAVFAGTSRPQRPEGTRVATLPLVVQFADGSEVTEWIDGREAAHHAEFRGGAAAVMASIDPQAVLLLDDDRGNNTRVTSAPRSRLGARLAVHWMQWLQDAMLVWTGVL
jgi:hypothetical protein